MAQLHAKVSGIHWLLGVILFLYDMSGVMGAMFLAMWGNELLISSMIAAVGSVIAITGIILLTRGNLKWGYGLLFGLLVLLYVWSGLRFGLANPFTRIN